MAHRLRDKHPELGKATRDLPSVEVNSWIAENSNGGMTQPSKQFYKAASATEEIFLEVHGLEGFDNSANILKSTVDKVLKKHPECKAVPRPALEMLVRTRTYFRIREFNKNQASYGFLNILSKYRTDPSIIVFN